MGSRAAKKSAPKKGRAKPLAGLRTTKRATPGRGKQPASQPAEQPAIQASTSAGTPGLRTRAGGRDTRRTTIYMPPDMAAAIERAAFDTRKTMSELVCAELAAKYGPKTERNRAS